MDKKNKKIFMKGFTLVELIIVITILGILGTIAFVSFNGYTKNSRDSNRLGTISNIETGLNLYNINTGKYPSPDNIYGTGEIHGKVLTYVGEVGESVAKVINISGNPKDPLNNANYIYGTTHDYKEYQIAGILEGEEYALNMIVPKTYAEGNAKAKVSGNYKKFIKFNIGNDAYVANVPSIIFSNVGTQNLLSGSTYYIVNKKENLPYSLKGTRDDSIKITDGESIIKEITNNSNSSLTGVLITGMNKDNFENYFTGEVLNSFNLNGINTNDSNQILAEVKNLILGGGTQKVTSNNPTDNTPPSQYFCGDSNLNIPPENSSGVVGSPTMEGQPWQYDNSSDSCYYSCNEGFRMNDWGECVVEQICKDGVESIMLDNGQEWQCKNLGATTVWNGTTQPSNCAGSSTNCNSALTWLGDYYQWGRNDTGYTPGNSEYNYGWEPDYDEYNDLYTLQKWGADIGETIVDSGVGGGMVELRQGPCPEGWHIPSGMDWKNMCETILGTECSDGMEFDSKIINTLKLPYGGSRNYTNGNYSDQGLKALYWSSSPAGDEQGLGGYFGVSDGSYKFSPSERANGYNIRCMKDGDHTF